MSKKLFSKAKFLVVFALILVLIVTIMPTTLSGGSAEQVQAFVTRFYVQCLNRQPDSGGLNEWVGRLMNGSKTGADVAHGFVFSEEFQANNHGNEAFLTILYSAFFNRQPDAEGYAAWLGRMAGGMNREKVLDGFLKSQEFSQLCANFGITPYAGAPAAVASTGGFSSSGATGFHAGRKVNFIIWGDDSAADRAGGRVSGRTDINLFVHLNLDTRKAYIVTIPRDTWFGGRKINGYHAIGGHDYAVGKFEQFVGGKIDFYAHHVNGAQALALTRARKGRTLYGGGAYAREKQSAMMLAELLLQKKGMVNSGNLGSFMGTLGQFIYTNISMTQAAEILPVLLSMQRGDIVVTTFNSWPQWFGKSSAVGYNEAEKNAFFQNILNQ